MTAEIVFAITLITVGSVGGALAMGAGLRRWRSSTATVIGTATVSFSISGGALLLVGSQGAEYLRVAPAGLLFLAVATAFGAAMGQFVWSLYLYLVHPAPEGKSRHRGRSHDRGSE